MKKIVLFLISIVMCFSLCSCGEKSPEQKLAEARRQSEISKKNADEAQRELDELRDAIDEYEYLREQIENAG